MEIEYCMENKWGDETRLSSCWNKLEQLNARLLSEFQICVCRHWMKSEILIVKQSTLNLNSDKDNFGWKFHFHTTNSFIKRNVNRERNWGPSIFNFLYTIFHHCKFIRKTFLHFPPNSLHFLHHIQSSPPSSIN